MVEESKIVGFIEESKDAGRVTMPVFRIDAAATSSVDTGSVSQELIFTTSSEGGLNLLSEFALVEDTETGASMRVSSQKLIDALGTRNSRALPPHMEGMLEKYSPSLFVNW